jgi:hypothetical protein
MLPDRVKFSLPLLSWVVLSASLTAQNPPADPAPETGPASPPASASRTESESLQFVVHGSDFVTRAAIASLAEQTRKKLIEVVGDGGGWKHAIVIQLHGKQGDQAPARTMRLQAFQVPGGFRLQLDVHLAKGKPAGLERTLLELLLIESGLRDRGGEPLDVPLAVPPWLLEGFLEAFRWRRGERDRELYQALFDKNQLFPVKKLLEIEEPVEMDSMTHAAFRASSGALVMALLEQGGEPMNAMLREVATFEGDEMALLMKHFPGMNLGAESFSKWWALQLVELSETPFAEVLTIRETEEELKKLLVVRFNDPNGNAIEVGTDQFRDLLALPSDGRRAAIRPVVERGGRFLYRAFPAHRPILTEYLLVLGELAYDKDDRVEARLQALADQRVQLRALGSRTRDYLEWYRITNAKQLSGDFESFIELKENLQTMPSERRGPVSEYLDSMQRIFAESQDR